MVVRNGFGIRVDQSLDSAPIMNCLLGMLNSTQLILIIWGFCICKFTHSLKLICKSRVSLHGDFMVIHKHRSVMKNLSPSNTHVLR